MSLIEIEFMKTNERFIKYEDDNKVELSSIEGDSQPASDGRAIVDRADYDDDNYTAKCGEILVSNSGIFTYVCAFCDNHFEKSSTFTKHMQRDHLNLDLNEDPLSLSDIGEYPEYQDNLQDISSKRNLNNQVEDEKDVKLKSDFIQNFCNYFDNTLYEEAEQELPKPTSVSKVKKEIEVKDPDFDLDLLTCNICNEEFFTQRELKKHKSEHDDWNENNSNKDFEPSDSDFSIDKRKTRWGRRKIVNKEELKCKYCHHEFRDRTKKIVHERIHTGEKPHKCDECGKCFRTKRLLKNHQMIHSGERPHICPHCGSAFTHRMNLVVHIRAHLGVKKFECEYCGKRFVRNVDRRIHIRSHTGEKPYQCEQCGTSFSTSSKLTEHRKRHSNTRPYKCQECDKSFYSSHLLKNHAVVHSMERPFECEVCCATFPRKRALISHVKIHSGIKEYVCAICGKGFSQNAGLYCHMKSHGEKPSKRIDVFSANI